MSLFKPKERLPITCESFSIIKAALEARAAEFRKHDWEQHARETERALAWLYDATRIDDTLGGRKPNA